MLAWIALSQQALRVLAVHLCYRNELVEDPALFQTAAPRVSARYGCHKFVPCRHAHLPYIRLCPLTPKRSKSDEATGLYSAAFQARQCGLAKTCMKLKLSFDEFVGARLGIPGPKIPPLASLIRPAPV